MKKCSITLKYMLAMTIVIIVATVGCKKKPDATADRVTDIDGNVYNIVTIGTQVWMAENLKTTRYSDGTSIAFVPDSATWSYLGTPGYCWYNNDAGNKNTYGAMYNWYAVNTGKLAPAGWHVPTYQEWSILIAYLGGSTNAGGKAKSTGTIEAGTGLWYSPNTGATNESGFSALPSGSRIVNSAFGNLGNYGYWWSSSSTNDSHAWIFYMNNNYSFTDQSSMNKCVGYSVRCVRDPGN
jgi:uncharacterized protein (TIGR02145 family)